MKYKLIVFDVDGTLLDDNKQLSLKTIKSFKDLQEKGIYTTIASGRQLEGLYRFDKYFPKNTLFITYNGATIINKDTKEIIYEKYLNINDAKIVFDYAFKYKIHIIVWNDNELYADEINEAIKEYEEASCKKCSIISDYSKFTKVNKIILYDYNSNLLIYRKDLISKTNGLNFDFSCDYFLEIYSKEVSKGESVKVLCQYLNIYKSEVIAFGDYYNDLSMIEYAGLGIAMGNAPQEVKEKASFVTKTNNDDGISYALDKFIK